VAGNRPLQKRGEGGNARPRVTHLSGSKGTSTPSGSRPSSRKKKNTKPTRRAEQAVNLSGKEIKKKKKKRKKGEREALLISNNPKMPRSSPTIRSEKTVEKREIDFGGIWSRSLRCCVSCRLGGVGRVCPCSSLISWVFGEIARQRRLQREVGVAPGCLSIRQYVTLWKQFEAVRGLPGGKGGGEEESSGRVVCLAVVGANV